MKPTEEVKERSCETEFTRRISEAARPTGKGVHSSKGLISPLVLLNIGNL